MNEAYICDAIRTPIGRFGGGLSSLRADDLAALSLKELMSRNNGVDWDLLEEVVFGFLQLFRSKECNLVDLVFQVGHCKCLFVPGCQTLEQSFPHESFLESGREWCRDSRIRELGSCPDEFFGVAL